MKRKIVWGITGLVMLFGSVLISKNASMAASQVPEFIVIGCTLPLTGRFASNGIEVKDGYEIGIKHINEAGGIFVKEFGKKLPLKLIRYEKMYSEDKVVAYLGSFSTVINTSLIAIAEKNKVPIVVSHFAHLAPHKQGYKYLFSPFYKTVPDFEHIFDALEYMSKKDRPKRVAIVMSRTEWPLETAEVYKDRITRSGHYQLVIDETYSFGSKDFSMIISKAKAAKAEVWLSSPTPPEGMAMIRQMKELNYNTKLVNMTQASSSRGWPGNRGGLGEYVIALENWNPGLKWPGNDALIKDAKERLGGKLPWAGVGTGYIDVQILANAIERAGTLDRAKIRDALAKTDMMTVGGPVKVRPDGTMENCVYACQWQNGDLVIVWPEEHATADPVYPVPDWSKR